MNLLDAVTLTLWWAEGTKIRKDKRWTNAYIYSIEITNTDPDIIMLFLRYLREILLVPEDKIRLQLQIHQGDDLESLEIYWSERTQIPRSRFNKTIIRSVGIKVGKSKGTCKIRVHDKSLHTKLSEQLKLLKQAIH